MKALVNRTPILLLLSGLLLLAACTPQAANLPAQPTQALALPTAQQNAAATATTAGNSSASFDDPFAYCTSVGTIDAPDARYTGPQVADAIVKGVIKASGAPADAPLDVFSKGTVWRCMDKQVYACFVGANLPCQNKANTSQDPTAAMNDFCKANPSAEFLPAAVTGHDTIYEWACKDGKAAVSKQVAQVDAQGYISSIWYAITP